MATYFRFWKALRLRRFGDFVRSINPIILWGAAAVTLFLFVYLVLFVIPAKVTFSVIAEVQYVEGSLSAEGSSLPLSWTFKDVQLCRSAIIKKEERCKRFTGVVSFGAGSSFRIRCPVKGPLEIMIQGRNNSIKVDNVSWPDTSPLIIRVTNLNERVKDGYSLVLPFLLTDFKLGDLPRLKEFGQPRILRNGVVHMYTRTVLSDQPFEVGLEKLEYGDVFVIDKPLSEYGGFIVLDENPGIRAIVRVEGREAAVQRFFMNDTPIRAMWFERLKNDPVIAASIGLLTFVLVVLSTIIAGRSVQR